LELVGQYIGAVRAKAAYDAMVAGTTLVPPKQLFSPCFKLTHRTVHVFELGFPRASLNDGGRIHDLVPGSAAARAGVKDADVVVAVTGLDAARKHEGKPFTVTLRRGEVPVEVTYVPRGAAVAGYGWVRNPHAAEQTCKF
jgi:predicted metalloprotease with PDZ domain